MGNLCTKKGDAKTTFDDFSQSDIDEKDDLNFANSVLLPEIPGDPMVKEYLAGKHDVIDRMKIMGDSFIIPKAKKIERVRTLDNSSEHLSIEKLQELDFLPVSVTDYSDMPSLVTPPFEEHVEHEYNNPKEDSYIEQYQINSVSPSTYGVRSPHSVRSTGQQPSFRSCLCDPSYSINEDSDSMSRFSDETEKKYVPSFDKKKWTWNKSARIGPRTIPITPIISHGNVPPPFFHRLVQPT